MTDIPKLNGKGSLAKTLAYAIVVLALAGYSLVKTIEGGSDQNGIALEKRLVTLETVMESLKTIPTDVAGIKVSIEGIKISMEKFEKKLDRQTERK